MLAAIRTNAVAVPIGQISNPWWYRYEVLAFAQSASNTVAARVRIYEHFWPGDVGGGPPSSFTQEVGLVLTSGEWKLCRLGLAHDERLEPSEPHGPSTSAGYVGRRPGVWLVAATRLPATGSGPGSGSRPGLAGGDLELPVGAQNFDAAWELAKYLLKPECQQEQAVIFSAVPGTKAGLDAPELKSDPKWRVVDQAMTTSRYVEWIDGISNWRNNVEKHAAEAMKLNEAPREALDRAQAEVEQELAASQASH